MEKLHKKAYEMLHDKLGILIGIILTIILYTFAVSLTSPLVVTNTPKQVISVKAGGTFLLCRDVEYTRDTEITLSRALTREFEDGLIETNNFNNITIPRKVGKKHICRTVEVPDDTPAGLWDFHTYYRAYTTPWWYSSFETPIVKLKVYK